MMPIDIFHDDVFLVSYPKSGRTWLRFLIGNYISGNNCDFTNSEMLVPDIDYNPQQCSKIQRPRFIQSHWPLTSAFKRVVYIARDGRDVAVSYYFHLMKFGKVSKSTRFEDFLLKFNDISLDGYNNWSIHVNLWLNHAPSDFLLVKYEDMKVNTVNELIRILEFAGLTVNYDAAISAVEASKFERMKFLENNQEHLHNLLANTDLSIKFVRNGEVGESSKFFNDELMDDFIKIHGSALKRLGYLSDDIFESFVGREVRQIESQQQLQGELLQMNPLPPLPDGKLQLVVTDPPDKVVVNSEFNVVTELTNNSDFILDSYGANPVHIAYHWLDDKGITNIIFDGERSRIFPILNSMTKESYQTKIKAPSEKGQYILRLTLVQEGVRWFDQYPTNLALDIPILVKEVQDYD